MSRLHVNPTRMELSNLKKQLQLSVRGHKLLKDKQDELVKYFIQLVREAKTLREVLETEYPDILQKTVSEKGAFSEKDWMDSTVYFSGDREASLETRNKMGVVVPIYTALPGGTDIPLSLSPGLEESRQKMEELFPRFMELASLEKQCAVVALDIEKTRRRVNALEYMTIPNLQETIRFIKMRLEDSERERITRLIKMQEYQS